MKNVFKSMVLVVLVNFSACAQDIIVFRNGEKIEAEIIELTAITIRYRRSDQLDGPIRNAEIKEVAEITYANGSKERFVLVEVNGNTAANAGRPYPKRRGPDRILEDKDRILEGGLFVDILPCYASNDHLSSSLMGMGARLGRKWYFGKSLKHRHGLQLTFIRFHLFPIENGRHSVYRIPGVLSPMGIGSSNAFKIKEKRGIEVNASIAPVILDIRLSDPNSMKIGTMYSLDVKYRHHRFAIGLDISRSQMPQSKELNMLCLTTGFKF